MPHKKKLQNLRNEVGICIKGTDGKHNISNVTNVRFLRHKEKDGDEHKYQRDAEDAR